MIVTSLSQSIFKLIDRYRLNIPISNYIIILGIHVHMPNLPCTLRTAGSLVRCSDARVKNTHVTMVLYSSVAGTCKEDTLPTLLVVISCLFSSDKSDPLTCQPITPVVELQLKVAVDPSVALTDVGVLTKPGI